MARWFEYSKHIGVISKCRTDTTTWVQVLCACDLQPLNWFSVLGPVVVQTQILEKPRDKDDAYRMLSSLSGETLHLQIWHILHELRSWRKRFILLLCILIQLEGLILTWHILQGANTKFILELLLYCLLLLVTKLTCCKGGMHITVMHTCSIHHFVFLRC